VTRSRVPQVRAALFGANPGSPLSMDETSDRSTPLPNPKTLVGCSIQAKLARGSSVEMATIRLHTRRPHPSPRPGFECDK